MNKLVIVESPTKAKTIGKYLGADYTVVASYGHIRDLLSKDGSVDPEKDFAMHWHMEEKSKKHLITIERALKKADELILATDPDREGEAIAWHVLEALKQENLKDKKIARVVFHEITKGAIEKAIKTPREINQQLVNAYLARRALDYLFGFTLSPLLWRKLPGARSAGRVQSVALRLIVEREQEIEKFISEEYWTISVILSPDTSQKDKFEARLVILDGKELDKLSLKNKDEAEKAKKDIESSNFHIESIVEKTVKRNPYPPFTTSTLQQEASKKLGFSATKTMNVAQSLYEGITIKGETFGLITYMRTDGINISEVAIEDIRDFIKQQYSGDYLPKTKRVYKNKVKNAQEAHEAIRPTDIHLKPNDIQLCLNTDQLKLYDLIWKRTIASQMVSAEFDQMRVDISSEDAQTGLRANGSICTFKGFLILYNKSPDEDDQTDNILPPLKVNEKVIKHSVDPAQHFTQPPARYTEASLVKTLEELGIGRPSTYASLIETLKNRKYVTLEKKHFIPELIGRILTIFLLVYFKNYVEYNFTAHLEQELDDISSGKESWINVLEEFWKPFIEKIQSAKDLSVKSVIDELENNINDALFKDLKTRECPKCKTGIINLKLSKFGAFLGCSKYPECDYTKNLNFGKTETTDNVEDQIIGEDPDNHQKITLKKGPYGFYLEWHDPKAKKPKRVSIAKILEPAQVDLKTAVFLRKLPLKLGSHENNDIDVGIGRFGPYIKFCSKFYTIPKTTSIFDIDIEKAIQIIASKQKKTTS